MTQGGGGGEMPLPAPLPLKYSPGAGQIWGMYKRGGKVLHPILAREGARMTQGGENAPPHPPLNTALIKLNFHTFCFLVEKHSSTETRQN